MRINEAQLKSIIDDLTLDKEQLKEVASAMRFDMELALQGRESSMPMLCSYIGMPTGQEKGEFLALDFGGTNLRAELVSLKGDCQYEIVKMVAKPLVTEEYNLINGSASAEKVFDFISIVVYGQDLDTLYQRSVQSVAYFVIGYRFTIQTEVQQLTAAFDPNG